MAAFGTYKIALCTLLLALTLIQISSADADKPTKKPKKKKPPVAEFDIKKTRFWGPGLSPDEIVLPVRYFYIELLKHDGQPYTATLEHPISVKISGKTGDGPCRTMTEVLNRKDGTYIARYRVLQKCTNFALNVTYNGLPLGRSPYTFNRPVYSEKCYCPQNIDRWLQRHSCDKSYKQIDEDLIPFEKVAFSHARHKFLEKVAKRQGSMSLCHYKIVDNHIYRKCYGDHVGFSMFTDLLFSTLTRVVKLPDMELLTNLGDWPLSRKSGISRTHGPLPIFSWCGSNDTFDIVWPSYDLMQSSIEGMSRVTIDVLASQQVQLRWQDKEPVAFWRGRDSRGERIRLVEIANANPDRFNASITNYFFFPEEQERLGPKARLTSFFEFFNSKYQINIDGTVAAYRFPYLLAGNSLVLKQDSQYYEHFYNQLEPMVHYVPFHRNLSNLVERVDWAILNDQTAQEISRNAQRFVNDNLMPDKVLCYYVHLLREWSTRLTEPVEKPTPGEMDEVKQKPSRGCECEPWDRDEL